MEVIHALVSKAWVVDFIRLFTCVTVVNEEETQL
jgi:hypothetical protein